MEGSAITLGGSAGVAPITEFKTKCAPGKTCVQQQKHPSSSRFEMGAASACAPALTVKCEEPRDPGKVPALQIPAVDKSRSSIISRNHAACLTRRLCTFQV